jgi:hypothetical protein
MRRLALLLLLALHVIGLSGCGRENGRDHWLTGPELVGDERYIWLFGLIEGKSMGGPDAFWTLKVPRDQLPEGFLQAFECKAVDRIPGIVRFFVEVDGMKYTIVDDGVLVGQKNGGPVDTYIYTDRNAFQSVKEFLLRYAPAASTKNVADWRMSKPSCA